MDDQKIRDILRRLDGVSGDDPFFLVDFLSQLFNRTPGPNICDLNEPERNELRIALRGIAALSVAKGYHATKQNDTKEMREHLAELKRLLYDVRNLG